MAGDGGSPNLYKRLNVCAGAAAAVRSPIPMAADTRRPMWRIVFSIRMTSHLCCPRRAEGPSEGVLIVPQLAPRVLMQMHPPGRDEKIGAGVANDARVA